jgi:hypothetical protein
MAVAAGLHVEMRIAEAARLGRLRPPGDVQGIFR